MDYVEITANGPTDAYLWAARVINTSNTFAPPSHPTEVFVPSTVRNAQQNHRLYLNAAASALVRNTPALLSQVGQVHQSLLDPPAHYLEIRVV